jgi:NADH dehydrogenase
LQGSAAKRLVFLSFLTADAGSSNEYLRYKAEAERAIRESGVPAVVFRCGHIYGPPSEPGPTAAAFLAKRGTVRVLGAGTQCIAPLYSWDVVEASLRAACNPATPTGTFQLAGPEVMTVAEFAQHLNPAGVRVKSTPASIARILGRLLPNLTPPLVEVMLGDACPSENVVENAERFGVQLHRLSETWPAHAIKEHPRTG